MNGDFALRDWRRFLGRYGATCVHARTVPHQEQLVLCAKSDDGLVHLALSYTAQTGDTVWANLFVPAHYLPQVKDWYNWGELKPAQLIPVLDRLIAIYGPQFTGFDPDQDTEAESRESRPKDTDLVAPATLQADGKLHGGDGASGETGNPSPAPAPGEGAEQGMDSDVRSGTATYPQAGTDASSGPPDAEGRSTEEGRVSPTGPDATNAEASRSPNGERIGELTAEGGTPTRTEETTPTDKPSSETTDGAGAEDSPPSEERGDPDSGEGGPVTSPRFSPRLYPGGNFSDEARSRYLARYCQREAREVARALRRLIRVMTEAGGIEETPRLDTERLCRELVSRRCHLARARRREADRGMIYLLADVSGSCSACCAETLAACLAVGKELEPSVCVLMHTNGWIIDPNVDADEASLPWPDGGIGIAEWIRRNARPVAGVVAFGDWDAGEHYRKICEAGVPLVWLDSYAARAGEVRPASARLRAPAKEWKKQPLAWYQGVNCAARAAIALRDAVRHVKGGR